MGVMVFFMDRSIKRGVVFGAGIGVLFYWVLSGGTISLFLIYGLIYGAVVGLILGGLNGIILGILTGNFHRLSESLQAYRLITLCVPIVGTFFLSLLMIFATMNFYSVTGKVDLIFIIIPATIAAIVAGYASRKVINEYLEKIKVHGGQIH